jgi:hypothetical protein
LRSRFPLKAGTVFEGRQTLQKEVDERIEEGSEIFTDAFAFYTGLDRE